MPTPFAINGFGRIGRALARIAWERPELELVAVHDRAEAATLAALLARDSVHGRFPVPVAAHGEELRIGEKRVPVFRGLVPGEIPWRGTAAKVVVEATGTATTRQLAARHLGGGVEKVLITAPAEDADIVVCSGVDTRRYDPSAHHVLSNASCTTHCLALLLRVLHRTFGVRWALMNEVHSYTGDQRLVDAVHRDPRRARAAAINIVPTTTAAPRAVEELLPELAGRVAGQAVRVPTPDVALLDLVVTLERTADPESINEAFRDAARGELAGLLAVSEEPLVSSDHVGAPHSAVVDALLTQTVGGELFRVAAWYDNEWGYAHRLADLLTLIGDSLA